MSKMSELHRELSEQAYDMGYESLGEAEQMGCEVDWENQKLIPPEEAAHNERPTTPCLKREKLIETLTARRDDAADLAKGTGTHTDEWAQTALDIDKAIEFIKQEVK